MKKTVFFVILGIVFLGGGIYAWQNYRGVLPVFLDSKKDITTVLPESGPESGKEELPEAINNTDIPLALPKGFSISILAKDLPGARDIVKDSFGNLWVSQTSKGKITMLEMKDGVVNKTYEIFKNLNRPHGLALDGTMLYFAEENKISRVPLYSDGSIEKLVDLPKGGRHYTRSLHFGSDGLLYVSLGSTCDVCYEKDERFAAIYSMQKDGTGFTQVAKGLRNSVFMATNPVDGKLWATEMGRDNLGNDLPPDEINIIEKGKDYGWPVCYGQNVHDTNFDKNTYIQNPCSGKISAHIELPAHSAPLGLAFIPETGWPEDYRNDLLVAFHGSWNRTEPTGYKIAHVKLDSQGKMESMEDFISGWLSKDGKTSLGRPVGLLALPGGIMYITDDKAGVVYKVEYVKATTLNNQDAIKDLSIKENALVTSPLKITGQAKGVWFFEGSFPVSLVDENNKLLKTVPAKALGEWMTENFVPFEADLEFIKPNIAKGWVVFKKDNPSGLPENDAEFKLPIKFNN